VKSRPLVVNLPPQIWQANRLALVPGDGPDPFWIEREFDAAGLMFQTIDPNPRPWNPAAGKHGAYQGIDPLRALGVLLTRRKAALVLTGSESPSLVLLALRRLLFFSPSIVIWELSWSPGWKFRDWLCRRTVPWADRTIVVGTNQIELTRKAFGAGARPVFIPLYVDSEFFRPLPPAMPPPEQPPYILSVGLDAGRDFRLAMDATRDLGVSLKIKAGRYKIPIDKAVHPHVEVIERYLPYPELRGLYNEAAMAVITTLDTPNACGVTSLMESMAMGKPTIISDNPALADYLPETRPRCETPSDRCLRTRKKRRRWGAERANSPSKPSARKRI
jgi:glycosyltransferase involved in cell wall biosynthesis